MAMMTEDEAKTKWCPFARVVRARGKEVSHGQSAFNRLDIGDTAAIGLPTACNCIASQCMAWRHDISPSSNQPTGRGFCGLAGISGLPQ